MCPVGIWALVPSECISGSGRLVQCIHLSDNPLLVLSLYVMNFIHGVLNLSGPKLNS